MNEVFLNGMVASVVSPNHFSADAKHLILQLQVPHRNRNQQLKHDLFTINVWSSLAEWAATALKPGTRITVMGYLTQQLHQGKVETEVTAKRIFIGKPYEAMAQQPHDLSNA